MWEALDPGLLGLCLKMALHFALHTVLISVGGINKQVENEFENLERSGWTELKSSNERRYLCHDSDAIFESLSAIFTVFRVALPFFVGSGY